MSFYDIETGLSALLHGADRRKDDRAMLATKLKAKLRELQAAGLVVSLDDDDLPPVIKSNTADEVAGVL